MHKIEIAYMLNIFSSMLYMWTTFNKCALIFCMCVFSNEFCVQFLSPVESTSGFNNTKHEMRY